MSTKSFYLVNIYRYKYNYFLFISHSDQRTNNVLESYNREFGNIMGQNPNIFSFAEKLDAEMDSWVETVADAHRGIVTTRQDRKDIEWPVAPHDFQGFVDGRVVGAKKSGKKK